MEAVADVELLDAGTVRELGLQGDFAVPAVTISAMVCALVLSLTNWFDAFSSCTEVKKLPFRPMTLLPSLPHAEKRSFVALLADAPPISVQLEAALELPPPMPAVRQNAVAATAVSSTVGTATTATTLRRAHWVLTPATPSRSRWSGSAPLCRGLRPSRPVRGL